MGAFPHAAALAIVWYGARAMQLSLPPIPHNRRRFRAALTIGLLLALGAALVPLGGCDGVPIATPEKPKPLDGVALALSCPDAAFADAVAPMVRSWEVRTGAKVTLARADMTPADATDLAVIPAGKLGEWAEPGHLAPLPARLRAADHPVRWFEFLPAYTDRLVAWGDRPHAVPLTGDGVVLVYRADRFADCRLSPPATWEEFARVAEALVARNKQPSLPPLPADAGRVFDLFSRIAASFDRPALSDKDVERRGRDADVLTFQFALPAGTPRLKAPGFADAAALLAGLHASGCFPPAGGPDDPVAALADGRAMLAVLSLDQVARLPREGGAVPARFGVTNVPGAKRYFDPAKGGYADSPSINYVPHFAGGRLGVVRTRCPHPDAAFDLLAEIGGPARGAELIATPGLGAGPTRAAHLDRDRLLPWLAYGFDEKRSNALQDALRYYADQTVKNPTFGLRGPDRAALTAAAGDALRKLGTGAKPADALTEALTAWEALDAKTPPATLKSWRQHAAGLN